MYPNSTQFSFAIIVFIFSAMNGYAQGRAAAVGVQTVELRQLAETIQVFAEVTTARDGAVASRVAGNVDTVHGACFDIDKRNI